MNWENSVIELPEDLTDWLPCLQETLADQEALAANAQRNHRMCLLQHDWCYRFQTLFNRAGLPIPDALQEYINALQSKANQLSPSQPSYRACATPIAA